MRIRQIKPSILINEELPQIGPYAYILFTGLWMYADREGRFEWRPRKIKSAVMPAWDDIDATAVENLLENLCKSGLLHSYEVAGKRYAALVNFKEHQHPDPREAASKIPPPNGTPGVSAEIPTTSQMPLELQCQHNGTAPSSRVGSGLMGTERESIGVQGESEGEQSTTPPPPKPKPPIPPPPPGAREHTHADYEIGMQPHECERPSDPPEPPSPKRPRSAHGMRHASAVLHPHARGEAPPRKGPGVVDWWPHSPEDVAAVRASLRAFGELHQLPPPDDAIVLRVLDAARGSKAGDIHRLLRWLHHREKFREIRSWGLLPVVISQHCSMASSA